MSVSVTTTTTIERLQARVAELERWLADCDEAVRLARAGVIEAGDLRNGLIGSSELGLETEAAAV